MEKKYKKILRDEDVIKLVPEYKKNIIKCNKKKSNYFLKFISNK